MATRSGAETNAERADRLSMAIAVPRPDDHTEFWAEALVELDAVPASPTEVFREDLSGPDVEVYDLRFTGIGQVTVAAWFCVPAGRRHRLPGLLLSPGYISEPAVGKSWARKGYAVMGVAPRGKLRADTQVNPGFPGLLTADMLDPRAATYRGFFLDAVRAFDLLHERREVDRTRAGVMGLSQGGGLSVAIAALRPRQVSCAVLGAPFLSAIMTATTLTDSYPYREITDYLRVHPEARQSLTDSYSYFDILNLAERVTCPTMMHIGLRDDICPPETSYALARALGVTAEIHAYEGHGHDGGLPGAQAEIAAFLARNLQPSEVTA